MTFCLVYQEVQKIEKQAKTNLVEETVMKELKEMGHSWGKAQAKAWDRVQWRGMIA